MLEMEHTDILTCPFQLAERDASELLVAADMFGGCGEECRRWTPTSIGRENLVEGSRTVHSSEIDPYSVLDRHDPELDLLPFMGVNAAEV
jgi:hypothetical protein